MRDITLAALAGALIVTGCASNPDSINAAYVSPLKYASYDCNQIAQEMGYLEQRTNTLYQNLRRKRQNDNWAMGLGMVLFWPALFALDGGDGPEATEYAQVKGEYEALRQNSVERSCNIAMQSPDEILESARRADRDGQGPDEVNSSEEASVSGRLHELDQLRQEGILTEEQYQSARSRILMQ